MARAKKEPSPIATIGRPKSATPKIGLKVFLSKELLIALAKRGERTDLNRSALVELLLRDRLGMPPLFDPKSALENA